MKAPADTSLIDVGNWQAAHNGRTQNATGCYTDLKFFDEKVYVHFY